MDPNWPLCTCVRDRRMNTLVKLDHPDSFYEVMSHMRSAPSNRERRSWVLYAHCLEDVHVVKLVQVDLSDNASMCQFISLLRDDRVMYGLIRIPSQKSAGISTMKLIFVHWVGRNIEAAVLARCLMVRGNVEKLFRPYQVCIEAGCQADLQEHVLNLKLGESKLRVCESSPAPNNTIVQLNKNESEIEPPVVCSTPRRSEPPVSFSTTQYSETPVSPVSHCLPKRIETPAACSTQKYVEECRGTAKTNWDLIGNAIRERRTKVKGETVISGEEPSRQEGNAAVSSRSQREQSTGSPRQWVGRTSGVPAELPKVRQCLNQGPAWNAETDNYRNFKLAQSFFENPGQIPLTSTALRYRNESQYCQHEEQEPYNASTSNACEAHSVHNASRSFACEAQAQYNASKSTACEAHSPHNASRSIAREAQAKDSSSSCVGRVAAPAHCNVSTAIAREVQAKQNAIISTIKVCNVCKGRILGFETKCQSEEKGATLDSDTRRVSFQCTSRETENTLKVARSQEPTETEPPKSTEPSLVLNPVEHSSILTRRNVVVPPTPDTNKTFVAKHVHSFATPEVGCVLQQSVHRDRTILGGEFRCDAKVMEAIRFIHADAHPMRWLVAAFCDANAQLQLVTTGQGGVEAMKEELHDLEVQFVLFRTSVAMYGVNTVKFVAITWVGPNARAKQKARMLHAGSVEKIFGPIHASYSTSQKCDITESYFHSMIKAGRDSSPCLKCKTTECNRAENPRPSVFAANKLPNIKIGLKDVSNDRAAAKILVKVLGQKGSLIKEEEYDIEKLRLANFNKSNNLFGTKSETDASGVGDGPVNSRQVMSECSVSTYDQPPLPHVIPGTVLDIEKVTANSHETTNTCAQGEPCCAQHNEMDALEEYNLTQQSSYDAIPKTYVQKHILYFSKGLQK